MHVATNIPLPRVFDADMNPAGRLHPAKVAYDMKLAPLSTGTLELAGETVNVGAFVELFDAFGSLGKFRVSMADTVYAITKKQTVKLEHAFTTLGDKVIPGYLEFGGVGTVTRGVLTSLLARQNVIYWTLDECDFAYAYQYSVENEYLINAILSVPAPFTDVYQWEFNTNVFPFKLSLKRAPTDVTLEMRANRNVQQVKQRVDRTGMRTRLYPRGYGEGVNQLTIKSVNGGVEYIQKNTGVYGIVEDIYPDTKITDAATLKAAAQAVLDGCSEPKVITEVSGDDVYSLTGEPLDRFRCGALGRVPLVDYDISIVERVVEVKKSDVYAPNQRAIIVFSNQKADMVADMARLMRKSRIAELYSQGSTCIYAISFNGNCDADNPLEVWIPIDANAASINVLQIKFKVTAFRAYSKAAAASGGQTRTSNAGTQATAQIPAQVFASTVVMTGPVDSFGDAMTLTDDNFNDQGEQTDEAAGTTGAASNGTTSGPSNLNTPSGGGGSTGSAGSGATGAASNGTTSGASTSNTAVVIGTTGACGFDTEYNGPGSTGESDNTSHYHTIDSDGSHRHTCLSDGMTNYAGAHDHDETNNSTCSHAHPVANHYHTVAAHTHSLGGHQHDMSHTHTMAHTHNGPSHSHTIPDHQHNIEHTHTMAHNHSIGSHRHNIAAHQHGMNHKHGLSIGFMFPNMTLNVSGHSHDVTFNDHTHPIEYGIFSGTTANSVTVKMGNNTVPANVADTKDFDAVPYMEKDSNGRIVRGWHKLTFTPDQMTGISGTAYVKTFVTAFTGGNY